MELWGEVQSSVRANQPNTRADEQQHRTHVVSVTFARSQFPSAWLKFVAVSNMALWEEVQSSVRANQPNTRADEQQQRTHLVVVTFATSHFEMSSLKFVLALKSSSMAVMMLEVSQPVMFPYFTVAVGWSLIQRLVAV